MIIFCSFQAPKFRHMIRSGKNGPNFVNQKRPPSSSRMNLRRGPLGSLKQIIITKQDYSDHLFLHTTLCITFYFPNHHFFKSKLFHNLACVLKLVRQLSLSLSLSGQVFQLLAIQPLKILSLDQLIDRFLDVQDFGCEARFDLRDGLLHQLEVLQFPV